MFFKGLKACWDDLITFFTLPPLESKPKKEKDKWDITAADAVVKYGSATNAMIAMFKDNPRAGGDPASQLMYMYLREEYFRKHPDDKL